VAGRPDGDHPRSQKTGDTPPPSPAHSPMCPFNEVQTDHNQTTNGHPMGGVVTDTAVNASLFGGRAQPCEKGLFRRYVLSGPTDERQTVNSWGQRGFSRVVVRVFRGPTPISRTVLMVLSDDSYVLGLGALLAFRHLELHLLAIIEVLVAVALDVA